MSTTINPLRAVVNLHSSKFTPELSKAAAAFLSSSPAGGTHTLPDLPYSVAALEPVVSAETMELHHSKHHNTYVTNLNVALEKLDRAVQGSDVGGIVELQDALKFNGGGHLNHSLFWENLCPKGSSSSEFPVSGALRDAVCARFGSVEKMKEVVGGKTIGVLGSGWGWLGYDPKTGRLEPATCANQDPLEATTGLVPLLGIDVWEHAYYVDYRNARPNYVSAIWDVINWAKVEQRLSEAKCAK